MGKHTPSKWLTLLAACFGLLMLYIDLFIVNVALPTIAHDFRASLGTASWTVSGYVLMIGVLPIGFGRLGDLWGQRVVYLAGIALFTIASLLCGLASSMTALIVFRVIQGIGAAIMTPGTLAIIIRAFPRRQHGLAIGLYGGISGLGLIAGPVLGGLLVQGESWRWIFLVNGPLGVAGFFMALLFVPQSPEASDAVPVDWPGLLFLSSGLLCLLFGVTRAGDAGWTNGVVIVSCLFGLVLLALFAMIEPRVRWPLIDLALFRNRPFVMGCLSFFLFSAALFGAQPYWSLFMQNTWGLTPLQGGLAFLPATALIALLTPLSGLLAQWAGPRLSVILVLALLAMGMSFFYVVVTLTPQSTYVEGLLPTFLVRGLAIPVISSCTTLAVMGAVQMKQSGLASGTLGMARNIGTAFGVAVLSQVYLFHTNAALPSSLASDRAAADQFLASGGGASRLMIEAVILQGFKLTALTCLVFCYGAAVLAFFLQRRGRKRDRAKLVQKEEQRLSVSPDGKHEEEVEGFRLIPTDA